MRLTQLEGKEDKKHSKPVEPSDQEIESLKELQKEMHKAMLDADLVMRRLAQILEKY